jgi:hypothetical protein
MTGKNKQGWRRQYKKKQFRRLYPKHSTIASGATTIGSTEHAPDEVIAKLFRVESMMMEYTIFEPILEKKVCSTIAWGATPIGSAERAPDDVY